MLTIGGTLGSGSGTFDVTAGTLQASGNLTVQVPVTVGTNASNVATVDANGYDLTLNANGSSDVLSGPGGLAVIDTPAVAQSSSAGLITTVIRSSIITLAARRSCQASSNCSIPDRPAHHGRPDRRRPRLGRIDGLRDGWQWLGQRDGRNTGRASGTLGIWRRQSGPGARAFHAGPPRRGRNRPGGLLSPSPRAK